jgi:DNA-binding transcriptional MerR regulator
VPYKEKPIEKLYYSIGEVAEMFHVSNSLIRFWETEFDVLKPRKNQKGNRLFTKKDIEHLRVIYYLVKEKGYTLEGARMKLKEGGVEPVEDTVALVDKLRSVRNFLEDLYKQI